MDGLLDEGQFVDGYPAIEGEEEPQTPPAEPGPESAEYWRKRAEGLERNFGEAQRKISDQGDQIAQLNQTFQALILQAQQQPTPPAAAGDDWASYYRNLSQAAEGAPPAPSLSVDDIARLADERSKLQIQATLQALRSHDDQTANLSRRFQAEHPDLVPYRDVAARFFRGSDPRAPMEDRFQWAIGQVRELLASGRLPKGQSNGSASRMGGGAPSGGMMNPMSPLPNAQAGQRQVSMEQMSQELDAWTKERIERQEKRKDLQR